MVGYNVSTNERFDWTSGSPRTPAGSRVEVTVEYTVLSVTSAGRDPHGQVTEVTHVTIFSGSQVNIHIVLGSTIHSCLKAFLFNDACRYAPLLNLLSLFFVLMPGGWMRFITITPTYSRISCGNIFHYVFPIDAHFSKNTSVKLGSGIQSWRWTPWACDKEVTGRTTKQSWFDSRQEYETFRQIREIAKIDHYLLQFSPSVCPHWRPQFPLKGYSWLIFMFNVTNWYK